MSYQSRSDDLPVEIERDSTVEVGSEGDDLGVREPFQYFPPRVPIHVPRPNRDDGIMRLHGSQEFRIRGSSAAVMRNF